MGRSVRGVALASALGAGVLTQVGAAEGFSYPGEAARLEHRLSLPDAAERSKAARELAQLPASSARPVILLALGDEDVSVRLAAAQAAASLRLRDVGALVIEWLVERDARLRQAATELLRFGPAPSAVEPLGRALSDVDQRVRLGAADALGAFGKGGELEDARGKAAVALLGHLDDSEPRVRVAVLDALGKLGDARAVLPLVSKLQDPEPEVRVAVARALGVIADGRATSALVVALGDRDGRVAAQVARALAWTGETSAEPSLLALAGGASDVAVRRASIRALGLMGRPEALTRLAELLAEPSVARAAEEALRSAGERAKNALQSCVNSPLGKTNAICARLLAVLAGAEAVPEIVEAQRRGVLEPASAVAALAGTGAPEAMVVALELLEHPEAPVRSAALAALVELLEMRGPDPRAAGPLIELYEGTPLPPSDREPFFRALGLSRAPEAATFLAGLAGATNHEMRLLAVRALGDVPSAAGDSALLSALADASGELRRAAALSLRASGGAESVRELISRFASLGGQDRSATALALGGPLSRANDERSTLLVGGLGARARLGGRDSLIEALGASGARSAADRELLRILDVGSNGDRAKVTAVAGSGAPRLPWLRRLALDGDPVVRAEASWGLGKSNESRDRELLLRGLQDVDGAVRVNSASALARSLRRAEIGSEGARIAESLCRALDDPLPAVRAAAILALSEVGATAEACRSARLVELLQDDASEEVRVEAARALARHPDARGAFERRRCSAFEPSPRVVDACVEPARVPAREPATTRAELAFVVLRPGAEPAPRVRYLAREAGVIRAGFTDRRGAFSYETASHGAALERPPVVLLDPGLLRPDQ